MRRRTAAGCEPSTNEAPPNQVEGLQLVSGEQVRAEIEPHVNVIEALWAPNTGIVDYRKVSDVYARRFTDLGGTIKFNSKLL